SASFGSEPVCVSNRSGRPSPSASVGVSNVGSESSGVPSQSESTDGSPAAGAKKMMTVPEHGGNGVGSGTFQPGSSSGVTHSRSSPSSQSLTESFWYSGSVSLDCAQILMLRKPQPPPKKLSSIFVTESCPTPRINSTLSGSELRSKVNSSVLLRSKSSRFG